MVYQRFTSQFFDTVFKFFFLDLNTRLTPGRNVFTDVRDQILTNVERRRRRRGSQHKRWRRRLCFVVVVVVVADLAAAAAAATANSLLLLHLLLRWLKWKGFQQVHVKKVNRAPQQGTATETSQPLVEVWQRRRKQKADGFVCFCAIQTSSSSSFPHRRSESNACPKGKKRKSWAHPHKVQSPLPNSLSNTTAKQWVAHDGGPDKTKALK